MSARSDGYETARDLSNQRRIANHIARLWRCEMEEMGQYHSLDYLAWRDGKKFAWVEIKNGNARYPMSFFEARGGYWFSWKKFKQAEKLSDEHGIPFFLVVHAPDGTWYLKFLPGPFPYDKFMPSIGRTDRNDPQDKEPGARFHCHRFHRLLLPVPPRGPQLALT